MKRCIPALLLFLPGLLWAQAPADRENTLLKGFGLSDSQIAQVLDTQQKTEATVRQDLAQLRVLRAQLGEAQIAAVPSEQEIDGYIDQLAQARAALMKTVAGARIQLHQIIGDKNFPAYERFIMGRLRTRMNRRGFPGGMRGPGRGGGMGQLDGWGWLPNPSMSF